MKAEIFERRDNMAEIPNCFDKAEYYFEDAMGSYCELYDKSERELTDSDRDEIMRYAGNHIGFYITWVIRKGELGSMHTDDPDDLAAAERVKKGELPGVDFLMEYCDGRLYPEDMSDSMAEFTAGIYDDYFKLYSEFVIDEINDLPLEFIGSWEDYLAFEPLLDRLYEKAAKSGNSDGSSAAGNGGRSDSLSREWRLL